MGDNIKVNIIDGGEMPDGLILVKTPEGNHILTFETYVEKYKEKDRAYFDGIVLADSIPYKPIKNFRVFNKYVPPRPVCLCGRKMSKNSNSYYDISMKGGYERGSSNWDCSSINGKIPHGINPNCLWALMRMKR